MMKKNIIPYVFLLLCGTASAQQYNAINDTTNKLGETKHKDTLIIDSLTVENSAVDTTSYRSIMLYRDSISNNLRKPYNKNAVNFKYDSFKEKMKDPWIGDILKNIFFR